MTVQLLGESNEIGTRTRHQRSALVVQAEKPRGGQRSGAQRVIQRELRESHRIAHRRCHVQMRACQGAPLRSQPSVGQLDRSADQIETFSDVPTVGIASVTRAIRSAALRGKCSPDRNRIDMDAVDDKTGCQPVIRQRCADDPRLTRAQRRHGIEQMGDAGCAIGDSLHDNGGGRLAVPDRNSHTR